MSETQPFITTLLISEISEPAIASKTLSSSTLDGEIITQTILKLADVGGFNYNYNMAAMKLEEKDLSIATNRNFSSEISPIVFDAWENLVKIVVKLISPASGWPSNLPQTPENITAYVTEEAYELLDTIHSEIVSNNLELNTHSKLTARAPIYILVKDLIPKLLWYIARTSDEIVRLLTGVEARVFKPDGSESMGRLRLAAILTIDDIDTAWSIDLATNHPPRSHLNSDTLIQSNDSYCCRYTLRSEQLTQQLKQRIQDVSPEIITFTQPTKIEFLEPGKKWQSGNIQLKFDLEFIADSISCENSQLEDQNVSNNFYILDPDYLNLDIDSPPDPSLEYSSIFDFKFTITQPEYLDCYYQAIMQQKLASLIFESQLVDMERIQNLKPPEIELSILDLCERKSEEHLEILQYENEANNLAEPTDNFKTESLVNIVVTSACEVANTLHQRAELSNTISLQPEIPIADLTLKLLWDIIRSSYEVMQLVGGVTAQVLKPGGVWETGTLRLVGILQADASSHRFHIDVATGQSRDSNTKLLVSKAIATSHEGHLCQYPVEIGSLAKWIIHKLRESSPEICLWMDGMVVELRSAIASSADSPQTNWQSGVLKLSIGFELLEEKSFLI
ncbi:MAG TPA: hypothetical protein VK211_01820 [Kamptonema sp.]|nr:hypothetical protein [Kamptonema sp.]